MVVCRNVGIYLQANLVWLYITLRDYSTEQFRDPLCLQNFRPYKSGNLLYDDVPVGNILLQLGILCGTTSRQPVSAYRLVLVNVWAELCPRRCPPYSLEFSPFLSTHLRSNTKKFVNYKQRALPRTDVPVPLTSLYPCTALHIEVIELTTGSVGWTGKTEAGKGRGRKEEHHRVKNPTRGVV